MRLERSVVVLAIAVLSVAAAGCPKVQIGAPCDLGAGDGGVAEAGPSTATINPGTSECPGRICVQPAADKVTTTGPLCSADCSSDDDCDNAQTTRSDTDPRCKSGFSCVVVTTVGPLCCKKLCACRDFFTVPAGGFPTPPACIPGMSTCANVR